jgi:hypothetical protein
MELGRHWRIGLLIGLAMTTAGVGCMLQEQDDSEDGADEINEAPDLTQLLKSTLLLDEGCTATKVGPYHLLTTARCVADKPAFKAGKTITFKIASGATQTPPNLAALKDAEADDTDQAEDDDPDATPARKVNKSNREATIDDVQINPSWTAKCTTADACPIGSVAASEVKDIAVILLDADLDSIPTLKVDLDEVGENDPVLAVGSGCSKLDGTPGTVKTVKTIAVAPNSVNHRGSVFLETKQKVSLTSGYIVTPGPDWKEEDSASICRSDLGAPLFRGNAAVVAGVTSSFTTFDASKLVPVTVQHTRVDTTSTVGAWLTKLKVETTHSCSETTAGCPDNGKFDGGIPGQRGDAGIASDAGDAGDAGDKPKTTPPTPPPAADDNNPPPGPQQLPDAPPEDPKAPNNGDGIDAGPKKEKKATGGCSAAPRSGTQAPLREGAGTGLMILGIAISLAALKRRRAA